MPCRFRFVLAAVAFAFCGGSALGAETVLRPPGEIPGASQPPAVSAPSAPLVLVPAQDAKPAAPAEKSAAPGNTAAPAEDSAAPAAAAAATAIQTSDLPAVAPAANPPSFAIVW